MVLLYLLLQHLGTLFAVAGQIATILNPFLYGSVFAYLLKIPCNAVDQRFGGRFKSWKTHHRFNSLTAILMVLLFSGLIVGMFVMVIPELIRSINRLITLAPDMANDLIDWISTRFEGRPEVQAFINSSILSLQTTLQDWMTSDLLPTLRGMLGSFASAFSSVAGFLYNIIIGLVVCIYLLLSRKRLARHGKSIIYAVFKPSTADRLMNELHFIDSVFTGFFGGRVLDSAIIGVICYVFCFIMSLVNGFSNGLLISTLVGVTNIIPFIGPFIGAIPSAVLVLMDSPLNCLIFVIFILILQQLDGNVIGPHILSGSTGLPGVWVLFSITLFGGLFGLVGVLVGVPVFAVLYNGVRRLTVRRLKQHGRLSVLMRGDDP